MRLLYFHFVSPLWEDNIKMGLREVGWGINWIDLAQDRDRRRAVVNYRVL
jgi:hypothetical protein